MIDPVLIYHPGLAGDETQAVPKPYVERAAYRQTYYALGWRSDDDPEYTGTEVILPFGGQTFLASPLVPNPASQNPQAAMSRGEVEQLIAESSAGFLKSMDPKGALSAFVSNQTTEATALNAVFPMPRITNEAVFKMTAWGICRCTAGGPVNFTMRLKNLTDGLTLAAATVSLIIDADGNREWTFEVDGTGQFVLADSVLSGCRLEVGSGTGGAAAVWDKGQAVVGWGTDPQNWDITGQFSVANAGILANIYGAKVEYALPGA